MEQIDSRRSIDTQADMEGLGGELAERIQDHCVIFLTGDLGAGKTTLVRGLLRALGYQGVVVSPTFTLLETYRTGKFNVVHVDLYRVDDDSELEPLAIRDYLEKQSVLLVEWAERARDSLPKPDCEVFITIEQDGRRTVRLAARTDSGKRLCAA